MLHLFTLALLLAISVIRFHSKWKLKLLENPGSFKACTVFINSETSFP